MAKTPWVSVNLEGWASTLSELERRRIVQEPVQNSMDTDTQKIVVSVEKAPGKCLVLKVEDFSSKGFEDIRAAYEMHRDTSKRDNPDLAGRFTTGEKKLLALCKKATIETMQGALTFGVEGKEENRQWFPRRKRAKGTLVTAAIRIKDEKDYDDVVAGMHMILPRAGQKIFFNGEEIPWREPVLSFIDHLPTVKAVSKTDRQMRTEIRQTSVALYNPKPGEVPMLYELGLPVVEIDCKWHVNVFQRVPLNSDRDNVPPAFMASLLAKVMNHAHELLKEADVQQPWVVTATAHKDIQQAAFNDTMTKIFGENKVVADPRDPESIKRAMSEGYTPIYGRSLTLGQHENNRRFGTVPTSSAVFPSPSVYAADGTPVEILSEDELTPGMKLVVSYMSRIGEKLLGKPVGVRIAKKGNGNFQAGWVMGGIDLFLNNLGKGWFEKGIHEGVDTLMIHELGHEACTDHLDEKYYRALCTLGAKLKALVISNPEMFHEAAKVDQGSNRE